jgi:hypothetical protein
MKIMIGLGKQWYGLYYLVVLTANQQRHPSSPQVSYFTTLWYCCLENLSSFRLGFMAKHLLHFSFQSNNTCGVCALAKQHRLSFSISSILSIRPFELIHCDIWGLYKVAFFSSSKYFLTIVMIILNLHGYSLWITKVKYKIYIMIFFSHLSKHNFMFL